MATDTVDSASSAVIVRLAYVPTFRDPEFLYATVPIAIWSEIEMSLAITAGSLPTLRPLYRVAAKKFSWKTSFFSARRSGPASRATVNIGGSGLRLGSSFSRKESDYASCGESERKIVNAESEEFVLEDRRPVTGGKFMDINKEIHVQVDYEDGNKKRSSKTAHNRELEVHGICEQLLHKVETLEQALEVKGEECKKLEVTVVAHEKRIEELVGKVNLFEGGSLPTHEEPEIAATAIRRYNEQITQLRKEVEGLNCELAEGKRNSKANK
ncbi:uncharacterized protein N0V89_004126 [Didymosphaeria variabile]|uniref:Uncharacterized protein n=1 Tax=Didymosphaeria variabile TaxID=1932322 RepID=A0A9W8XNW1_9PLEO|nr:uncharacterized protein N0V89_004126 [Didymosphaeria variabile]KAJ4356098.1 hypothetical protein N0V89_004126 [Didymosphaeria variabile]